MKVVYKYQLPAVGALQLPLGAQILTVQIQNGTPTLWALVKPDNTLVDRFISIVGTGWEVEGSIQYINTYMDGPFVWHAFEILK